MTRNKDLKRLVRARMNKTGEAYTTARAQITKNSAREISALVSEKYKVPDWWTQTVTVGYERIKGLRARGQRRDGTFEATKSRTIGVPVTKLFRAWATPAVRKRWLEGAGIKVRTATAPKSMRLGMSDGTIVAVGFMAKGRGKSSVAVQHARLPRERQLDQCALCHGGLGTLRTEAFSYVPGQPLAQHLELRTPSPDEPVDVHGNQVALLERSRCFRSSQMTCATCHDVHRPQRDVAGLSNKCLTCHTVQSCGLFPLHNQTLAGRCVDCHMPKLTSNTIVSSYNGREERIQVRTHWIKIYPQTKSP
jgi:hypothetical protein